METLPLQSVFYVRSELLPCAVSVLPTVDVTQHPLSENLVNVICQVKKFYPQRLLLTWLENGNVPRTETASSLTENKDGTFNWTSWLLVFSSAHREDMLLTCQVAHDGQLVVNKNLTLETVKIHGEASTLIDPALFKFYLFKKHFKYEFILIE